MCQDGVSASVQICFHRPWDPKCFFTVLLFSTVFVLWLTSVLRASCFWRWRPQVSDHIRLMDLSRARKTQHKALVDVRSVSHFQVTGSKVRRHRVLIGVMGIQLRFCSDAERCFELSCTQFHNGTILTPKRLLFLFPVVFLSFFFAREKKAMVCLIYEDIWLLCCKINYFLKRKTIGDPFFFFFFLNNPVIL